LGSLVDVSIAGLLVAGILPGILLAGLMVAYTWVRIFFNPGLEPQTATEINKQRSAMDRVRAVIRILPFSLVIFFVMGLIMLGIATPSESAATGWSEPLSWPLFIASSQ
jgi:TRAP-type mannitol/chloroaromatic compound transport system permease large subunit